MNRICAAKARFKRLLPYAVTKPLWAEKLKPSLVEGNFDRPQFRESLCITRTNYGLGVTRWYDGRYAEETINFAKRDEAYSSSWMTSSWGISYG